MDAQEDKSLLTKISLLRYYANSNHKKNDYVMNCSQNIGLLGIYRNQDGS